MQMLLGQKLGCRSCRAARNAARRTVCRQSNMNYFDGQPVQLGDMAAVGGGMIGCVIGVIHQGLFSEAMPKGDYGVAYGAMVKTDKAGWVLITKSDDAEFLLIQRRTY